MDWPNLTDLIIDADADAPVGLVGAPLGLGSVTPGRCDLAPALLRATLRRIARGLPRWNRLATWVQARRSRALRAARTSAASLRARLTSAVGSRSA